MPDAYKLKSKKSGTIYDVRDSRVDTIEEQDLDTRTTALESRATTLESDMDTVEGIASSLEDRATAVEGRATTLESDMDSVEGRAAALEGRATTLESDMDAVEGRASALEGRATTLEDDVDAVEDRATALEGRATTLENGKLNKPQTSVSAGKYLKSNGAGEGVWEDAVPTSAIQAEVQAWLNAHIQEGAVMALDDTLSEANAAADAKKTGELVAPQYDNTKLYAVGDYCIYNGVVKRCIVSITTAENYDSTHWITAPIAPDVADLKSAFIKEAQGDLPFFILKNKYIDKDDNGAIKTYSGWDCTEMIPINKYYSLTVVSSVFSNYNGFYRKDGSYINNFNVSTTKNTLLIPSEAYYVAFSNTRAGMTNLFVSFELKVENDIVVLNNKYEKGINAISNGYIPLGNLIANEYIDTDGEIASYSGWDRTDFINISGFDGLIVKTGLTSTNNAFYDSNKEFISRLYTYADYTEPISIPSNAVYIRLSNVRAYMATTTIYNKNKMAIAEIVATNTPYINSKNSILFLNDVNTVGNRIVQAKFKRQLWSNPNSIPPVLQLAVITDIHASNTSSNTVKQLSRFIEFCNSYTDYFEDMLCLGDVVLNDYTDDFTYWNGVDGSENILNTIGNHDAYVGPNDTSLKPKTDLYNRYFAPYIDNWGVTQPDNAATNGFCYYYKDYTDNKVRLIVLDCMNYDTDQNNWLIDVLADAITSDLAVVIAQHYNLSRDLTPIPNCNFVNKDYMYSELVIGVNTNLKLAAVDDFINNGGKFVCWLSGDTHYDAFGVYEGEHGKQLSLTFENASVSDKYNDSARIRGAKSQDSFNFVAIDTDSSLVKVTRVGNCENRMLQSKKCFCYNYETHQVVSIN